MIGSDFSEEVDCGSFFDQFDDLIEFPADNECGLGSGSYNTDFPSIWPDSGSIFSGNSSSSSAADLSTELSVPYEDIVQLEWLSNFVEDSFSGGGMTLVKENPPIVDKDLSSRSHFQTSSPVSVLDSSSGNGSSSSSSSSSGEKTITPLSPTRHGPQRARSKRPRPASFNPRPAIQLISPTSSESEHFVESRLTNEIPKKKKKVKTSPPNLVPVETNRNQPSQAVRKCLHCEITKTPQWRAGPLGPKTLCNACGVRFKSGRLFPEYRPAASPTFVASLHSNSHKKVVEMRSNGGSEKSSAVMATKPELIPNRNPLMGVSFE